MATDDPDISRQVFEAAGSSLIDCQEVCLLLAREDGRLVGHLSGEDLVLTSETQLNRTLSYRGPLHELFEILPAPLSQVRNALLLPLRSGRATAGALAFLGFAEGLQEQELEQAETLSALGRLVLRHNQVEADKARLEREMQLAWEVKREFLPASQWNQGDYQLAALLIPAGETGGDVYDYLSTPDGRLWFLLADAAGKGLGPSLVVTQMRAYFKVLTSLGCGLGEMARRINLLLCQDLAPEKFVTACFGFLELENHRLEWVDCGHGLNFWKTEEGLTQLSSGMLPLGVLEEALFQSFSLEFGAGDLLALFTDGWLESRNSQDEEFGRERLLEALKPGPTARAALSGCYEELTVFLGGLPASDDLTALFLRRRATD